MVAKHVFTQLLCKFSIQKLSARTQSGTRQLAASPISQDLNAWALYVSTLSPTKVLLACDVCYVRARREGNQYRCDFYPSSTQHNQQ